MVRFVVFLRVFVLALNAGEPDGRDAAADEQDQQHMPKSRGQAAGGDEGRLGLVLDCHDVTIEHIFFFFFFVTRSIVCWPASAGHAVGCTHIVVELFVLSIV